MRFFVNITSFSVLININVFKIQILTLFFIYFFEILMIIIKIYYFIKKLIQF